MQNLLHTLNKKQEYLFDFSKYLKKLWEKCINIEKKVKWFKILEIIKYYFAEWTVVFL
jgi:hypothetical protein